MSELQTKLPTDTWVTATWDEYIRVSENPAYEKAKGYYYNGQLRIEMPPVGPDHADDNGIIVVLINLFGIAKAIPMRLRVNCSYRKLGVRECQPDASYYINERVQLAPQGSSVVDLDSNQPPDLAIEVAHTSLADDLGAKRMLYEDLGVAEYWVVDVQKARITAFKIVATGGSQRITESQVLPGLVIALLEAALQRSRQMDNTSVGAWFLAQV
ncbi:MAG: Uma2 family endonuclease [Chroococcidiopsidaceae cyanobacterium CP_BM_RX_35]|nr:Uma2 family endonuclease [Chroococcidiopsidaceae cyanobacterium CP_BM_RX_35]